MPPYYPSAWVILDSGLRSVTYRFTLSTPPSKVALIPVSIPNTQKSMVPSMFGTNVQSVFLWQEYPSCVSLEHLQSD